MFRQETAYHRYHRGMELDYSIGCVNFRDVGEWINDIAGRPVLPLSRIFRGGKIDFVRDASEIGSPGTIINLRKGADREVFGARYYHFPISNDYEKYRTETPEIRKWLRSIFRALQEEVTDYPILFHCMAGKDRTGIVIAALLSVLGMQRSWIVEEYLLSDGGVKASYIEMALDGIGDPVRYFGRLDLDVIRARVLGC